MFGVDLSMHARIERAKALTAVADSKVAEATALIREYKALPAEVRDIVESARMIFDAAPVPIWCKWADEGRNLYCNPHYKSTIVDYEGQADIDAWAASTANEFTTNDQAATLEPGGLLVYERGQNPAANRGEHWWIAKWRQIVPTANGPRTLVWGIVLSTVAHHRQGPTGGESRAGRGNADRGGQDVAGSLSRD